MNLRNKICPKHGTKLKHCCLEEIEQQIAQKKIMAQHKRRVKTILHNMTKWQKFVAFCKGMLRYVGVKLK